MQNYFYDLHDQPVKAEIFKKNGTKETWAYTYDALGRRIGKGRLKNEEVSETSFPHDLSGNGLEEETGFVWDGSHLLQEVHPDGRYTYLYTDQDSYEPLAQVRNWTTEDGESRQQIHYFHCDQIGIPREMTDKDGNLVWFGDYYGWGKLKSETNITGTAHQPFRLQNQYCDRETGLHYNFFRYYDPDIGRFVNQDPIGLEGGENLYAFAPNAQNWIDPSGNIAFVPILIAMGVGALTGVAADAAMQVGQNVFEGKPLDCINLNQIAASAALGAIIPPAYKLTKCAAQVAKNANSLRKNSKAAKDLKRKYDQLFGKPNSGKLRRRTGRKLSRTDKSISNNKSQMKKYGAIGAGVYGASKVVKEIVGGEKQSLFSNSSCE
ncbi:RHS repeat domain-containing protein [Neisseria sp. Marseille-Q1983]|uniref:RHS repeat domain-containing protein n=1 Tax=Neisseria sp. Marseille-Q1983 TaxID=2830768 RepID=UPI003AAFFB7D